MSFPKKCAGRGFVLALALAAALAGGCSVALAEVRGAAAVAAAPSSTPAASAKSVPAPLVRMLYYRESKNARASLFSHPGSIDLLAPQSYSLDAEGVLRGSIDPAILAFAARKNIKVMPLVSNQKFDSASGEALLDDPRKQDAAVAALIAEAEQQKFFGWQIDFEQLDASYRDKYSAFVKRASDAFRPQHLAISVALVAQISSNPADYKEGLWQHVVGVYDYAALASSTDFVSVMAYDDPESPGPVARSEWVKRVISHGLLFIPREKFFLGIPLYAWTWNDTSGKLVKIGGWEGIKTVLAKYGAKPQYSTAHEAPYIRYTSKKKHYTIWYENARSVQKKLELIRQNGLAGFSAWALGLEVPGVHDAVKNRRTK